MKITSLEEHCQHLSTGTATDLSALLPPGIQQEIGYFNVFELADLTPTVRDKPSVPFACRSYATRLPATTRRLTSRG